MCAKIIHAVEYLSCLEVAECYGAKLQKKQHVICNLEGISSRSMKKFVQPQFYVRVELRKLKKSGRQKCDKNRYEWLSGPSGCLVVHFVRSVKMDHTMCVDD